MEKVDYNEALISLLRVIAHADGVFDDDELKGIQEICAIEGISDAYYNNFSSRVENYPERKMYQNGIKHISACTKEEQIKIFVWLYKMSKVDGTIHVKEVRFLLYASAHADIEFEDVEAEALRTPDLKTV